MSNPFALLDGSESEEEFVQQPTKIKSTISKKISTAGEGKRVLDRHSDASKGRGEARKDGGGKGNWGSYKDDMNDGEPRPVERGEDHGDEGAEEEGDSTSEEEFSLEEYEAQQAEKKAALAKYTNKGKIRTVQASAVSALQKADEEFWADQKKEDKHKKEKSSGRKGVVDLTEFLGKDAVIKSSGSDRKGKGEKGKGKGKGFKGKDGDSKGKGKGKGKSFDDGEGEFKGKGKSKKGKDKGKGKGKGDERKGKGKGKGGGGKGYSGGRGHGHLPSADDSIAFPALGGS